MNTFTMETCFVCDSKLWLEKRVKTTGVAKNPAEPEARENQNQNQNETENEDEKDWILLCHHLNVPQSEIDEYKRHFYNKSKSQYEVEPEFFPLCPKCSIVKGKILILHQQLESIQNQLKDLSNQLTTTIKNTHENNNKNSSNTRKSKRGTNSSQNSSNEGIQRLRQVICDQQKSNSSEVSKLKNSEENTLVSPVNSPAVSLDMDFEPIPISTMLRIKLDEKIDDDDDDEKEEENLMSKDVKKELESEDEGEHENQEDDNNDDHEEDEDENENEHNDFFYGIYEHLSASFVDTSTNEENSDQNSNPSSKSTAEAELQLQLELQAKGQRRKARRKVQTPEAWIANIQKRRRMLGEEYISVKRMKRADGSFGYVKQLQSGRVLGARCECAIRDCAQLTEEERQSMFHQFWKTMDWEEKQEWVRTAVFATAPKRRTKETWKKNPKTLEERTKEVTFKYFLPLRGYRKIQVCRTMFLHTLGLGESIMSSWLKDKTAGLKTRKVKNQK